MGKGRTVKRQLLALAICFLVSLIFLTPFPCLFRLLIARANTWPAGTVVLNTPTMGSSTAAFLTINFTYIPSIETPICNSTLYIYTSTGALFTSVDNASRVQHALVNGITYTFNTAGTYNWSVTVWNQTYAFYAAANFSLTVTTIRYFANQAWTDEPVTTYNLSLANIATTNYTGFYASSAPITIYCGIKVYTIAADNSATLVSGSTPVAIGSQYFTSSSSGFYLVTGQWEHDFITTSAVGFKVEVYSGTISPPTTLRDTFKTENTTVFNRVLNNTWVVAYYLNAYCAFGTLGLDFFFGNSTGPSGIGGITIANTAITSSPISVSNLYPFVGQSVTFSVNWSTSTSCTLTNLYFSWNITGTWTLYAAYAPGVQTYYWNLTETLTSSSSDYVLGWREFAYDTNGILEATANQTVYVWKTLPSLSKHFLGTDVNFWASSGTGSSLYSSGAEDIVFITYMNTTFAGWHVYVCAYDVNNNQWAEPYDLGLTGFSDNHYNPVLTILPNGSLAVIQGYEEHYFQFNVSPYNATTDTNVTEIVSSWNGWKIIRDEGDASYPQPVRFKDKLLLLFRTGYAGAAIQAFTEWNGTYFWHNYTEWAHPASGFNDNYWEYSYNSSSGYIFAASYAYNNTHAYEYENLYFCYSPDKGVTWKTVNGTTLTLPIATEQCLAALTGNVTVECEGGILLDENNVPIIPYHGGNTETNYGGTSSMCIYSTTLGNSGTWTLCNVTDENGATLTGNKPFAMFMEPYYGKLGFWGTSSQYSKEALFVRIPGQTSQFHAVWTDPTDNATSVTPTVIPEMLGACEVMELETWSDAIGNFTVGSNQAPIWPSGTGPEYTYRVYGCLYTAQQTIALKTGSFYINDTDVSHGYTMAFYSPSNMSRLFEATGGQMDNGHAGIGWSKEIAFPQGCWIREGEQYYVVFAQASGGPSGNYMFYSNESSTPNQGIYMEVTSTAFSFPDTFVPLRYENISITLAVYGGGVFLRGESTNSVRSYSVAVTDVRLYKTIVGQGSSLNVTVAVLDTGDNPESFNVTLYANTTEIETLETTLSSGNSAIITFVWNTTGIERGTYNMNAYAWPVLGETDTSDNNSTGGSVILAMVGDITGPNGWPDGKVDIKDISYVAKRFGTIPSSTLWNPNADVTGPTPSVPDGKTDIRDISAVAKQFGEH